MNVLRVPLIALIMSSGEAGPQDESADPILSLPKSEPSALTASDTPSV